jgi:hypothetical protein
MVNNNTKTTAVFVVFAVALWYGAVAVSGISFISVALLFGVGIVLPILISERKSAIRLKKGA